jgi:hypothetical protein
MDFRSENIAKTDEHNFPKILKQYFYTDKNDLVLCNVGSQVCVNTFT